MKDQVRKSEADLEHDELVKLREQCRIMRDALTEIAKDYGTDYSDGNTMIAREALVRVGEK